MTKIMVAPRGWTKVAHQLYVFFNGHQNTWVECEDSVHLKFGAIGLWGVHRGPVVSLPTSWDRVIEKRTVTKVD